MPQSCRASRPGIACGSIQSSWSSRSSSVNFDRTPRNSPTSPVPGLRSTTTVGRPETRRSSAAQFTASVVVPVPPFVPRNDTTMPVVRRQWMCHAPHGADRRAPLGVCAADARAERWPAIRQRRFRSVMQATISVTRHDVRGIAGDGRNRAICGAIGPKRRMAVRHEPCSARDGVSPTACPRSVRSPTRLAHRRVGHLRSGQGRDAGAVRAARTSDPARLGASERRAAPARALRPERPAEGVGLAIEEAQAPRRSDRGCASEHRRR